MGAFSRARRAVDGGIVRRLMTRRLDSHSFCISNSAGLRHQVLVRRPFLALFCRKNSHPFILTRVPLEFGFARFTRRSFSFRCVCRHVCVNLY